MPAQNGRKGGGEEAAIPTTNPSGKKNTRHLPPTERDNQSTGPMTRPQSAQAIVRQKQVGIIVPRQCPRIRTESIIIPPCKALTKEVNNNLQVYVDHSDKTYEKKGEEKRKGEQGKHIVRRKSKSNTDKYVGKRNHP